MLNLGQTVQEALGLPARTNPIGIEIEMEANNDLPSQERVSPWWGRAMDGSLRSRSSAEYVLAGPMTRENAFKALNHLTRCLEGDGSVVKDTVRAGVHVHLNVIGATLRQVMTFATCYYVLEEALTDRFCGDGRSGNHFCLRGLEADYLLHEVRRFLQGNIGCLSSEEIRYAALNYNAMYRHGSLEFRALRTPTDLSKIKTWVDMLLGIKEGSKMFANPREVVEEFSMGGEENFLHQMLKDNAKELYPVDEELVIKLRRGVRVAQEIAYCRGGW